jgi:cobalt-precorrin-5B (C1)-methyltransferase
MGDFVGAMLKHLRRHPVPRLTIAGGVGKLAKFADGHLDLHSGRSQVNHQLLASLVSSAGGGAELVEAVRTANTALGALQLCQREGLPLADLIADRCRATADDILRGSQIAVDIVVIDRAGTVVGRSGYPA